jgi:TonB family protein
MKKNIFIYLLLYFVVKSVIAYNIPSSFIIEHSLRQFVTKIEHEAKPENKIFIQTPFASPLIISSVDKGKLKKKTITKIELVYTSYKLSEKFNQDELNFNRLEKLRKALPFLFSENTIEWVFTVQTACNSPVMGKTFFHGFIIHYRSDATLEEASKEIEYLDILLGEKNTSTTEKVLTKQNKFKMAHVDVKAEFNGGFVALNNYVKEKITNTLAGSNERMKGIILTSFTVDEQGKISNVQIVNGSKTNLDNEVVEKIKQMPLWKPALLNGRNTSSTVVLPIKFYENGKADVPQSLLKENDGFDYASYLITNQGLTMVPIVEKPLITANAVKINLPDSSTFKILERNTQWNNLLIAVDVTGSMYPYLAQVLLWYKENEKIFSPKAKLFAFFNDGDNMSDKEKKTGEVGGIYTGNYNNFETLKNNMKFAMLKGGGGDREENNMEAILKGIAKCKECENILLIADNFATPRDLSLVKHISKPIHVLLCGTNFGINTHYLDLARATKGSIHTANNDIINLHKLAEGEEITIEGTNYIFRNNKFEQIFKKKNK